MQVAPTIRATVLFGLVLASMEPWLAQCQLSSSDLAEFEAFVSRYGVEHQNAISKQKLKASRTWDVIKHLVRLPN